MDEDGTIVNALSDAASDTIIEQTSTFINWGKSFLTWENLFKLIGAFIVIFLMWLIYRLIIRGVKKLGKTKETANKNRELIFIRIVKYLFYIAVALYVLSLFGIKLSAIWGAAGIAGVAIGFAAQTSVSNFISGLFVLTEGTMKIGDMIIVGDVTGIVDSISLLSIRVHTLDNQLVRIPNSTIINSNLTNNSFHKTRRMTLKVSISYNADMKKALEALAKAPALCPTVLKSPAPAVWFDGFGDSGIDMTVAVWLKPADFLTTKNDLYCAMKQVLDEAKIEIPYNQLDVLIKNQSKIN